MRLNHCSLTSELNQHKRILLWKKDCKLASPRIRDRILAFAKTYNKDHSDDKLCKSHLRIGGERQAIFVTEHLSLYISLSLHKLLNIF